MRRGRFKADPGAAVGYYHCISRVVDRQFRLGDLEKEAFMRLLRLYESFCEVRVVTYCVLGNHFHVLVEVPRRPEVPPDDVALLARLARFYSPPAMAVIRQEWALRTPDPQRLGEYRESFLRQMWDVSHFMKMVKQRFSRWFNRQHGRQGTLWEERFRSVLVEGAGETLAVVAAYIDLNPVRAGLVDDPKDYRWCGYAEAVAGNREQAAALERVLPPGSQDLGGYRKLLHAEGAEEGRSGEGQEVRRGIDRAQVRKVWAAGGQLSVAELLRCRVRYFVDGVVLGSRGFVEEAFVRYRSRFGPRRRDGARPVRGVAGRSLFSLRALRVQPIE